MKTLSHHHETQVKWCLKTRHLIGTLLRMQLIELFGTTSGDCSILPAEWDSLIQEASSELLLPALRGRIIAALGEAYILPSDIDQVLTAAETLNRERNQVFVDEAVKVAKLLNTIGIKPVALKGLAYLLAGIYPDPASRYLLDIDFLIPENLIPDARSLLHQHGFVSDTRDIVAPLRHHAPPLARRNYPPLELHHQIALGVGARLLPVSEVFASAKPIERDGAVFLIPSATHLINHLILHSQLHNAYRYRALPPLRALHDLLMLSGSQPIDWPLLVKRYQKQGEYLTLALHLKEANRVLGLALPFPLHLGLMGNLRSTRRRLISRCPWLRFFDPVHIVMATLRNRLRMIRRMIGHPELAAAAARAFIKQSF